MKPTTLPEDITASLERFRLPPPIPDSLDCPAFRETWESWLTDRRKRGKRVTATGMRLQLKKLAQWGPEGAIESLEQSIANGWIGLFPPPDQRQSFPPQDTVPTETASEQDLADKFSHLAYTIAGLTVAMRDLTVAIKQGMPGRAIDRERSRGSNPEHRKANKLRHFEPTQESHT